MAPIAIIFLTILLGMAGQPFWVACASGMLLATIAIHNRRSFAVPTGSTRQLEFMALSVTGSVLIGQSVSIGTFAAGRALAALIS